MTDDSSPRPRPWWRDAVIYEVYPRSFSDASGDGDGDLRGVRDRLPYLAELGIDGIWIAPWYPSPMADGGYDVSDYYDIHPMFGTLDDAVDLIAAAHQHGVKVIIDLVANHCSDQHPWFQAALAAGPGSPERDRFIFRNGAGEHGERPPNNWIACFGGPGWTRVTEPDGGPGQWYYHMFAAEQPDLNWRSPQVWTDFDKVLRFWLDLGVDGLRVDAAPAMAKLPDLRDADYGGVLRFRNMDWTDNPHWDVDDVHEIMRHLRAVTDSYPGERVLVAEAVVGSAERLSRYVRPGEMHSAFNFPYLKAPWEEPAIRSIVDTTLKALAPTGAPATWVLASHDEFRQVTRYGRAETGATFITDGEGLPADLELGFRRSRAALMLMLALPGSAYLYQGEELGLPQVEDLPDDLLQDPMWRRSGGTMRGRDGCRVPMPWDGRHPPFGFSPPGTQTWLPQPDAWASLTVEAQLADPGSMLSFYRQALRLRREVPSFRTDAFAWRPAADGVLDFDRGPGLRCVVNLSEAPVPLPPDWHLLLSSGPLDGGSLPQDATVWLGRGTANP